MATLDVRSSWSEACVEVKIVILLVHNKFLVFIRHTTSTAANIASYNHQSIANIGTIFN